VLLAEAFERETGCPLEARDVLGTQMLMPVDERLGSFGIVVGAKPDVVFPVRSYGPDVHLIVWGAKEKQLDRALRKITGAA
jgi:hypothetical protein